MVRRVTRAVGGAGSIHVAPRIVTARSSGRFCVAIRDLTRIALPVADCGFAWTEVRGPFPLGPDHDPVHDQSRIEPPQP